MLLVFWKENWTFIYIISGEVNVSFKLIFNFPNFVIQPLSCALPCFGNRILLDEIHVEIKTEVLYVVVPFRQSVDVIHVNAHKLLSEFKANDMWNSEVDENLSKL